MWVCKSAQAQTDRGHFRPPGPATPPAGSAGGGAGRREGRAVGLRAFFQQLPSNCGIRCSHRPGTRPSLFCLPGGGPGVALGRAISRTSRSPSGHPASIQAEAGRGPPSPRGSRLRHFLLAARRGLRPPKEENPGARVTRPIAPVRSGCRTRRAAQGRVGVRSRS